VQLRFDVRGSPNLPDAVRLRLERLADRRLTREGVLVINAQRHRTQERNRQDARGRLVDLIRRAAVAPIPRRATKPTAGSRERRLESKKHRAAVKGLRQRKLSLE
jgi:ribosome-associated protein